MKDSPIDDAVRAAFASEGPAAFATAGAGAPHLVATWQSYLEAVDGSTLIFPAGGYHVTEANLKRDPRVWMVVGSRLPGGPTSGFRLAGTAALESGGAHFERLRARYPWCRAAVVFRVTDAERILGS